MDPRSATAEMPPGAVNTAGNFREGSDEPYVEALANLGLADAPAPTPMQEAVRAQPPAEAPVERNTFGMSEPPAPTAGMSDGDIQPAAPAGLQDPYAAPAPAEPEPPAEEVPGWAQAIQEENQRTQQALELLAQRLVPQAQPQTQPEAELPNLDLMSGEELRQYIGSEAQRIADDRFNSQVTPLLDVLGSVAARESETAAKTYFAELEPHVGRFNHDEALVKARALAAMNPRLDPAEAMVHAAQQQHQFEKTLWQSFSEQKQTAVTNAAAAPTELAPTPVAATVLEPEPEGPDRYTIAAENFMARRRPQPAPQGV